MTQHEAQEIARAIRQMPFDEQACLALNKSDLPFLWIPGHVYGQDEDDKRTSLLRMIFVIERKIASGTAIAVLSGGE